MSKGQEAFVGISAVMLTLTAISASIAHCHLGFATAGSLAFGVGVAIAWLIFGMWLMAQRRRTSG